MVLLGFTLGSLAAIRGLAIGIRKRVVIARRVVVIVPYFAVTIALLFRDGYTGAKGLAIWDREVRHTTAGLSLANVLANSYLDTLVSKGTG